MYAEIEQNTRQETDARGRLVSTAEAASVLHVHEKTRARWARTGFVPSYRMGNGYRFVIAEVLEALRTRAA